jgi:uncharacterized protein
MRILMSGADGLIGRALTGALNARGDTVARLKRGGGGAVGGTGTIPWNPSVPASDTGPYEGFDAAVHLAGETVAQRWTPAAKRRIMDSRVLGTRHLAMALCGVSRRPAAFICASAVGIYGDRGAEELTEQSPPGTGFLAGVGAAWEAECVPLAACGVRVANMRLGIVLSPNGGALAKMRLPFSLGLGGVLGSGRQYMSWIALEDVVAAFLFVLDDPAISGPVNLTAPQPVKNREFTRQLAAALHRPAVIPVPAFAVRLALGELGTELMLASIRAVPARLLAAGFRFRHPDLADALAALLEKKTAAGSGAPGG